MNLLGKFLNRTEFKDYEDFKSAQLIAPKNFNFGFDVVDEYASVAPAKRALVWCNSSGDERIFNFKQLSDLSNQAVNFFIHSGLKSGDYVMTMLNR
ncbi:MAG: acetyl-CoA synthetase, partial [Clostridia bacterium]